MKKFLKVLLVFLLIFSWVFSAWPQIEFERGPTPLSFPPEIQEVQAVTPPNVSGWAWSSTIGWISFSSTNCDADGDGLVGPGAPAGCPADGTAIPVYGVNIETGGNMTGYAWSANIGWIHFDETAGFPALPNYSAKVDTTTGEVSGWARALAHGGGWDGWISMRGTTPDYGVSLDKITKEFRGWAWGDDVIGWISFSHRNCDYYPLPNGDGFSDGALGCPATGTAISVYGVTTTFVIAGIPSAGNLTKTDFYCGITKGQGAVWLSWLYQHTRTRAQAQYHLQIATSSANLVAGPWVINVTSSAPVTHNATGRTVVTVVENPTPGELEIDFNTTYHWRIKVKDVDGLWSDWATGTSFTTQIHASPWPDFTLIPIKPAVNEEVQFIDESVCFGLGGATTTCTAWSWDFTSTLQHPTTTFAVHGRPTVTLTVTGPPGFTCARGIRIDVAAGPPEWIEIPPIIWMDDERFASFFHPLLAWAKEPWVDAVGAVNGFQARIE